MSCKQEREVTEKVKRSLFEISRACGGRLFNCDNDIYISKIVNNDKQCEKDCLYVAINGEKYDGMIFAKEALSRGACAVLTESEPPEGVTCITVSDCVKALGDIAAYFRKKELETVIAVTGSVGKTTVKEMTAAVLSAENKVLKTEGNKNNLIGLPLTLLSREDEKLAVVEAGISEIGEMERLSEICSPNIAVITALGHMHAKTLGGACGIAKEKAKITRYLQKGGTVFIPSSAVNTLPAFEYKTVTVGADDRKADFNVCNMAFFEDGSVFDVRLKDGRAICGLRVNMIGRAACIDGAFAVAVGLHLGISENQIRTGLGRYKNVGPRQNILRRGALTVFSDCYNSGPESAREALDAFYELARIKGGGKRILLIGSMLELGKEAESLHIALGKYIAEKGADALITVGDIARNVSLGALIGGMPPNRVTDLGDGERDKVSAILERECAQGGFLFIKGSRALKMEEFIPEGAAK